MEIALVDISVGKQHVVSGVEHYSRVAVSRLCGCIGGFKVAVDGVDCKIAVDLHSEAVIVEQHGRVQPVARQGSEIS